jgi:Protein of unknown function (DUF1573)
MKRWIILIVFFAVMAGAVGLTVLYINGARPSLTVRATNRNNASQPKAEIAGALEYDFGKMSQMRTDSHMWEVKNVGNADLVMWMESESSTSKCTIANMMRGPTGIEKPRMRLKPNETTRIEVQWRTKQFVNWYSTRCIVGTNDPDRPIISLSVKGMVNPKE